MLGTLLVGHFVGPHLVSGHHIEEFFELWLGDDSVSILVDRVEGEVVPPTSGIPLRPPFSLVLLERSGEGHLDLQKVVQPRLGLLFTPHAVAVVIHYLDDPLSVVAVHAALRANVSLCAFGRVLRHHARHLHYALRVHERHTGKQHEQDTCHRTRS